MEGMGKKGKGGGRRFAAKCSFPIVHLFAWSSIGKSLCLIFPRLKIIRKDGWNVDEDMIGIWEKIWDFVGVFRGLLEYVFMNWFVARGIWCFLHLLTFSSFYFIIGSGNKTFEKKGRFKGGHLRKFEVDIWEKKEGRKRGHLRK